MPKRPPTKPPPHVLRQIADELQAPRFLGDLLRWAERACGRLTAVDDRRDPDYALGVVQAAIADTLDGIRQWDPARVGLRRHLEQVINSRVWHDCERARSRRYLVLHGTGDSEDQPGAEIAVSLQQEDARTRPDGGLVQRDVRERLYRAVRALAHEDVDVLALIDAYESGDERRDDVMARLGWSLAAFVNVRRRLDTLIRRLPVALRDDVIEVLTRDGGAAPATVVRGTSRRPFPEGSIDGVDTSTATDGDDDDRGSDLGDLMGAAS